ARAAGQDPNDSSRTATRTILAPALGCAATTLFGFMALTASPVPAIRRFGLLAAAGIAFTFLLSFTLLPVWLRLFARSPSLVRRAVDQGRWQHYATSLVRKLEAHANVIACATAIAALALVWAWSRLEVDTDPMRILPAHHPFRVATEEIGKRLGGTDTFDLVLEPPAPAGGMFGLVALAARLQKLDGIAGPAGVPRLAKDGTALIPLLLEPAGTTARERTFARAEDQAREVGWRSAQACGSSVSTARDSGAIARGEIYGILASLLALIPCIWIGLRSMRLTLLGLAANLLPCFLLHGGLALAGRPLSVGSAMIGSVILGIVVDDAIYFLHAYRSHIDHSTPAQAVAFSLRSSGRAITVTSMVLALGFLSGALGELSTTREFAYLASATILAAWAANLLLLPAFLLARLPVRARRGAA
ncbi:MAG: MMPL family transporter, partial [Cytophagaceae bacterium]|nr:MMPL family transporter [Gemmatimonadaceae bacterium]